MDWFLYDIGLRREELNIVISDKHQQQWRISNLVERLR